METLANPAVCMAQSVDMKPTMVYIGGNEGETVEVKPVPGAYDKPLWVPAALIFVYDEPLFRALSDLYERGETDQLRRHWNRAHAWQAA